MKKSFFIILLAAIIGIGEFSFFGNPAEQILMIVSRAARKTIFAKQPMTPLSDNARSSQQQMIYEKENSELRRLLAFRERTNIKIIGADVIGYSTDPERLSLIINRGSLDSIQVGMPVIAGGGDLLGRIRTVEDIKSIALPLTDPRSKILVMIQREKNTVHGIAEGRFNVGVEMTFIPITEEIRVGDIVVTSGLQEGIPAGLAVGTVQEIQKKPENLFQTAILSLPYPHEPPLVVSIIIP